MIKAYDQKLDEVFFVTSIVLMYKAKEQNGIYET